jgi:hypothetical protein
MSPLVPTLKINLCSSSGIKQNPPVAHGDVSLIAEADDQVLCLWVKAAKGTP